MRTMEIDIIVCPEGHVYLELHGSGAYSCVLFEDKDEFRLVLDRCQEVLAAAEKPQVMPDVHSQ